MGRCDVYCDNKISFALGLGLGFGKFKTLSTCVCMQYTMCLYVCVYPGTKLFLCRPLET